MSPTTTPPSERTPGILPICPPPRPGPDSHKTPQLPNSAYVKHPRKDECKYPKDGESRTIHQRRLGLIPEERKESLIHDECKEDAVKPMDSISVRHIPVSTDYQEDFPTLNSSVQDFLGLKRSHTTKHAGRKPVPQSRRRDSLAHSVKVCNHRGSRKCFDMISQTFGPPDPRDLYKEVHVWLHEIVEDKHKTVEQQFMVVKGMKTFLIIQKEVGRNIF